MQQHFLDSLDLLPQHCKIATAQYFFPGQLVGYAENQVEHFSPAALHGLEQDLQQVRSWLVFHLLVGFCVLVIASLADAKQEGRVIDATKGQVVVF